jgi:hypothetical protein
MAKVNYLPKIIYGRLKTGGRTVKQYEEELKEQGFTCKQYESMVRADGYFDGLEVWVSLWNYDNHERWHLWSWKQSDDETVMMALYEAEQFHPYATTRYKNNFEKFKKDWKSEEYDPSCTYTFTLDAVEVLEVVQEEENNIDTKQTRKAAAIAKEAGYQKKRRRQMKKNRRESRNEDSSI